MGVGGRPAYQPTDKDRATVFVMVAAGVPEASISRCLGISDRTLRKHYRHELDTALDEANAKVAGTLLKTATDRGHPHHVRAAEFWLKTRARWRTADTPEPAVPAVPCFRFDFTRLPAERQLALLEILDEAHVDDRPADPGADE